MDAHDLFGILAREHAGLLRTYLRSAVRDPHLADDLFQETLIVAWRRLDSFDRSRPFGPWLRGIAAKLVLARARQGCRDVLIGDEAILASLDQRCERLSQAPGDTLEAKLAGLRDCLDRLPQPYRETVRLRYQEEVIGPPLAERLGIGFENVKKRLQRGRAMLRDCLERHLERTEVSP